MKKQVRVLGLGLLITFAHQQVVFSQDDSLDFSDLDKVEKEEFGGDTSGKDSGDFDLEGPSKEPAKNTDLDDLDKEMNELDSKPAKPGSDTVDLEKELDNEAPQEQQATEPSPAPEALPPLETPEKSVVEEPSPAPSPQVEEQEQQAAEPSPPPAAVPAPSDEPNSKLEARLNRIYQKFMTEKTTDEEWMQIKGDKGSENYSIQQGDTLWDISVTIFGNGYFWPKIWQLNDDITNPHIIIPGKVLRFTPGTLEQAPQMKVTDAEGAEGEETVEQNVTEADKTEATDQEPQIPPPTKTRAVLKNIPPSLPFITYQDEGEFDNEGFAIEKQGAEIQDAAIALAGYLTETEPVSVGEVVSVEQMGAETASTFQYVYVKSETAKIGDVYTAYGVGKSVEFNNKKVGIPIDFQGTIKIVEKSNIKEPIYKALVTSAIGQVMIGSKISKEQIPKVSLSKSGKENGAHGQILGGTFDSDRRLFGDHSVLYLNVGANQGLTVGDVMPVVRNDKMRNPDSPADINTKKIGSIKIAKITPTRATAVVLQAVDDIMPGDLVGSIGPGQRELIYYDPGESSGDADPPASTRPSTKDDLELE